MFFAVQEHSHDLLMRPTGRWRSICGLEFPHDEVDWAGDYEPAAWRPCTDCKKATGHGPRKMATRLESHYAASGRGHLLAARQGLRWVALCGRTHDDFQVSWSGDHFPAPLRVCGKCSVLSPPAGSSDDGPISTAEPKSETESGSDLSSEDKRQQASRYRLWVVGEAGVPHRPRPEALGTGMCGFALTKLSWVGTSPRKDVSSCSKCNSAVGKARSLAQGREQRSTKRKRKAAARAVITKSAGRQKVAKKVAQSGPRAQQRSGRGGFNERSARSANSPVRGSRRRAVLTAGG